MKIPGTFSRPPVGDWELRPNPGYPDTPRIMKVECHDGTPFLTVHCSCGTVMHTHESRTTQIPADAEIASRCMGCGDLLVFPPGWFHEAFAQMRSDGWIQ